MKLISEDRDTKAEEDEEQKNKKKRLQKTLENIEKKMATAIQNEQKKSSLTTKTTNETMKAMQKKLVWTVINLYEQPIREQLLQ